MRATFFHTFILSPTLDAFHARPRAHPFEIHNPLSFTDHHMQSKTELQIVNSFIQTVFLSLSPKLHTAQAPPLPPAPPHFPSPSAASIRLAHASNSACSTGLMPVPSSSAHISAVSSASHARNASAPAAASSCASSHASSSSDIWYGGGHDFGGGVVGADDGVVGADDGVVGADEGPVGGGDDIVGCLGRRKGGGEWIWGGRVVFASLVCVLLGVDVSTGAAMAGRGRGGVAALYRPPKLAIARPFAHMQIFVGPSGAFFFPLTTPVFFFKRVILSSFHSILHSSTHPFLLSHILP